MPKTIALKPAGDSSESEGRRPSDEWFLYLLRRSDGGLYTGITTDVARRFDQHSSGKGARALRGKSLVGIVYSHSIGSRSLASKVEYAVKRLTKVEKERLVREAFSREQLLDLLAIEADG